MGEAVDLLCGVRSQRKLDIAQIINYTFPDPRYRIQMEVEIGYGQDIEKIRQIITESMKQVEGILLDKPIDVLYIEMGDAGMVFRVRWWIESYVDTRRMYDRVNTALQDAFDSAGVEMANLAYDIKILNDPDKSKPE